MPRKYVRSRYFLFIIYFSDSAGKPWLLVGAPKGVESENIKGGTVNACNLDNLQTSKIQCNELQTNIKNANPNEIFVDQLLGVTLETSKSKDRQEVKWIKPFNW